METTMYGALQGWDPVGPMRGGGFYFHVGVSMQSDMKLAKTKKGSRCGAHSFTHL